jgi:hypothetical protein
MNAGSLYTKVSFALIVIILFSAGIYGRVFTADYLYLDEAYMLWNKRDDSIFMLNATQGRILWGIIYQKLFAFTDTVGEMKYVRILTLAGWVLSSAALFWVSKKWVEKLALSKYLPFLLSVFCICSSAVSIYIGWSICNFPAFLAGLYPGHLLLLLLTRPKGLLSIWLLNLVCILALGVASLLIYQAAFPIFILPFLLLWIAGNIPQKNKKMIIGISVYLATYLIYFLVFKYYLKTLDIQASTRTEIIFDPVKKIKFFFSSPFSQAWNLNLLHNLHNIVSQLIPILLFALWLFLFIKQAEPGKIKNVLVKLAGIIILLFLSYLPSLIAKENFSSYRSMLVLNLCAFSLFAIAILAALKTERNRKIFILLFPVFLFVVSYFNFNFNFIQPLRKEFSAISNSRAIKTATKNDTIIFIRPDSKLFKRLYGIQSYKDEFGSPSTYRDWTPDGLTRQLIQEQKSYDIARSVKIYQFENEKAFIDSLKEKLKNPLVIDVNTIMMESEGKLKQ